MPTVINVRAMNFFMVFPFFLGAGPACLFFDAEIFRGRLEYDSVNALFGQLHGIEADSADLIALLLHRHIKPILMLHGIALAFVVASGVSLVGLLPGRVMKSLAQYNPAGGPSGSGNRIAIGKLVAEIR